MLGVVVLNYNNYRDTINCVDSILCQDTSGLAVCIVDNGSSNDSESILKRKYETAGNVEVIRSEMNIGFARGNNEGISRLRETGCSYIFVINSDIVLKHKDVMKRAIEADRPGVGLISPVVISPEGHISNIIEFPRKVFRIRMYAFLEKELIKKRMHGFRLRAAYRTSQEEFISKINPDRDYVTGCMFVLTPEYFEQYDGLYDGLFLYYEEWATMCLLHEARLRTTCVDAGEIIHLEGASTPKKVSCEKHKMEIDSIRKVKRLLINQAVKHQ